MRRPVRPDLPRFAPIVDSDDGRGGNGDDGDQGLMRALGLIVLLGIVIAALLLPPISILERAPGRGDGAGGGVVSHPRDQLPDLPAGLVALSALHDLQMETTEPPPYRMTVPLSAPITDATGVAFYTYDGGEWRRLAGAELVDGGRAAAGDVSTVPSTIAVMRRTSLARVLGVIVDAGEAPDPAARAVGIISVGAASPALAGAVGERTLDFDPGGLDAAKDAARGSDGVAARVFLGVEAAGGPAAEAVDAMLATPEATQAHVSDLVAAARDTGAAGVHLDYSAVDAALRPQFTAFVRALSDALSAEGLGLAVGTPAPVGANTGAYDWPALTGAAEALWLHPPGDPHAYYDQLEAALEARRAEGIDLSRVWLVLDRRSRERGAGGVDPITLRDALTLASSVEARVEQGIAPADAITVAAAHIDPAVGNSGLHWDDRARAVAFEYGAADGPRTVWVENRFSAAFRLDLARRFGLGGVVLAPGAADETLPAMWDVAAAFAVDDSVRLELPYGPYLEPRWLASDGLIEGAGGTVVWRAPQRAGVYDVTLVVSDGVVFVGQQVALRVSDGRDQAAPTPSPTPTATATPSPTPTAEATEAPPPAAPTTEPTQQPTAEPTAAPAPPPSVPPGPAGNQ